MKTSPWLLALVAGAICGAPILAGDRGAAASAPSVEAAAGYAAVSELLSRRYVAVATVSTADHCLAITAEAEARTLVDSLRIEWCASRRGGVPELRPVRPLVAKIEISTNNVFLVSAAWNDTESGRAAKRFGC